MCRFVCPIASAMLLNLRGCFLGLGSVVFLYVDASKTLATMAGAARVDLQASDKGLASCMVMCNVTAAWADAFIQHHRLESLEDFIYIVDRSKWESSLKELADEVAPIEGQPSGFGSSEGCV